MTLTHLTTLSKNKQLAFLLGVLGAVMIVSGGQHAYGLGTQFPDDANSCVYSSGSTCGPIKGDARATVSTAGDTSNGGGVRLNAPKARFKIFIPASTPSQTIKVVIQNACVTNDSAPTSDPAGGFRGLGTATDRAIKATLYEHGYPGGVGPQITQVSGCTAANPNDFELFVSSDRFVALPAEYGSGYRVMLLDVEKANNNGGAKAFRVIVAKFGSYVTFAEIGGDASSGPGNPGDSTVVSMWDATTPFGSNLEGQAQYEFGPSCSFFKPGGPDIKQIYLKWTDADYNGPEESYSTNIRWDLIPSDGSATQSASGQNMGGNGVFAERPVTIKKGVTYIWRWSNVNRNNGIQVWMPFSEVSAQVGLAGCAPSPDNHSCNITMPDSVLPGAPYSVTFTITNGSTDTLSRSGGFRLGSNPPNVASPNNSGTQNYMSPDAADPRFPEGYNSGQWNWVRQDFPDIPGKQTKDVPASFQAKYPQPNGGEHTSNGPYGANLPVGDYPFEWKIVQEGALGWTVGNICKATLHVRDIPDPTCNNIQVLSPLGQALGSAVEPGEDFIVRGSFTNNSNTTAMSSADYKVQMTVTDPSNIAIISNADIPYDTVPPTGTVTFQSQPVKSSQPGYYKANVQITGAGVNKTCDNQAAFTVAYKPYTRTYGGDVAAGGSIKPTGQLSCTSNSNARIAGFSGGTDRPGAGSGVQFAAQALSTITGFNTALGRTSNPIPIYGLAFSNVAGSEGKFGDAPCLTNYFDSLKPGTLVTPFNAGYDTGTFYYDSATPFSVGGSTMTIFDGARSVVYVDGDAVIDNNIIYADESWTSMAAIPSLYLVVRGNIYIDGSVSRLDGVYVAQKKADGTGGTIYTCADVANKRPYPVKIGDDPGALSQSDLDVNAAYISACNNKLRVNGAFVAQTVKLLRTKGTLRDSSSGETLPSGTTAEEFNYTPELWLLPSPFNNGTTPDYNTITSLPPVL